MRKCFSLAVCLTALLALSACVGTPIGCLKSIQAAFPYGEIKNVPGMNYSFIIKDKDGSIWYAETKAVINSNITEKIRIF